MAKKTANKSLLPHGIPILVAAGLAVYLLLFFSCSLFSVPVPEGPDQVWSRGQAFLVQLTLADQIVLDWGSNHRMEERIDDRFIPLVAAISWLIAGWWIGFSLMKCIGFDFNRSSFENHGLALACGLQLLSLETFLLGWFGFLGSRWPLLSLIVATMICGVGFYWRSQTSSKLHSFQEENESKDRAGLAMLIPAQRRMIGLLAISLGGLVMLYLMGSLLPPIEFDVREYHLQAPKEFFQEGKIGFVDHNIYANMPLGAEMHPLAWMVLLGGKDGWFMGALIGKVVIASFAVIGAMILGGIARRYAGLFAGWIAATAYLCSPGIAEVSRHGLIDGVVACYAIAAYSICSQWRSCSNSTWRSQLTYAVLLGWILGGAASCKYTSVPMIVLPAFAWALFRICKGKFFEDGSIEKETEHKAVRNLPSNYPRWFTVGAFLLSFGMSCGPWYLKNAIVAHNPVYPLMGSTIGGKSMTPERISQWNRAHQVPRIGGDPTRGWPDYRLTTLAGNLLEVLLTSKFLGVILIPFAFIGGAISIRKRNYGLVLGIVWVFGTWWCFTHRLDRFWIPLIPLASVLAGIGGSWLAARWNGWILYATTGIGVLYGLLLIATWPQNDNRILVSLDALRYDRFKMVGQGADSEGAIREAFRVPVYQHWLNDNLSNDQLALIVGDAQVFDIEVPILYSTCFDRSLFETATRDKSPREQWSGLRSLEVTHVVVHWSELNRYRSPGNYGFSDYVQREQINKMIDQGVLRRVPWPIESEIADLYGLTIDSPN